MDREEGLEKLGRKVVVGVIQALYEARPVQQGTGKRPRRRSAGGTAGRRPEGTLPIGC